MKSKSKVKEGNAGSILKLFVMAVALCVCSVASAQVKLPPPPEPLKIPDLVISSLSAKLVPPNKVQYSWTITNVGAGSAKLEGPTPGSSDNVSVQAMLSKDTVFGNAGDLPAGGTIVGNSPLPDLAPLASKSGTFTATVPGSITLLPHLVLKVDSRNALSELNETNNTAAVGVAR